MNFGRWWLAMVVFAGCGTQMTPEPEPRRVARLELSCPQHSVPAYDFTRSLLAGPSLACTVRVSDVHNAPLKGVQVNFLTEAGRLRGGLSNDDGEIELVHEVSLPTPLDVPPANSLLPVPDDADHTGQPVAPEWMRPSLWGKRMPPLFQNQTPGEEPSRPDPIRITDGGRPINNPRDNLVTLVAWVDGSEPFEDANGNGWQDIGESFVDLTEPFVDANDDGTWNQGEAFVDANGNQQWDGKNLAWDWRTKLWVQERVLWTGFPATEDVSPVVIGVAGHRTVIRFPSQLQMLCTGPTTCGQAVDPSNPTGTIHFYLADPWFNAMTRPHTGNGCAVVPQEGASLVTYGRVSSDLDATDDAPDGLSGTVNVRDARDPSSPQTSRPRESPGLRFSALIRCEVRDGTPSGQLLIHAGRIDGLIE